MLWKRGTEASTGAEDHKHLLDTRTTVAGAVCVSANLLRLCLSLSSAAFLAVALICATVTCGNTQIHTEEKLHCELCLHQWNLRKN